MSNGIYCFIFCFGISDPVPESIVIDSYCQRYERQVVTAMDAEAVKKLPPPLARRIQGNEVDYLCKCLGWKDKSCKAVK